METQQQQSNSKQTQLSDLVNNLAKKFNNLNLNNDEQELTISFVTEDLISEILSKLPVKTLLQFRSVSKPWLSLFSNPLFTKLQLTQATAARRTAVLISAYDTNTRKRYLLSADRDGGPVIIIVEPYARTFTNRETTEIEHLNGLVLFSSGNGFIEHNFAYVVNPSTRKMFKLRGPGSEPECLSYGKGHICYFFGFDESRNEHKVLTVRMFDIVSLKPFKPIEIMIFSLSGLSWRKIDVDLPCEIIREWNIGTKHSVCVNSVIHLILQNRDEILAFDLRTEKFSIVNLPFDALRDATDNKSYCKKGLNTIISNQPFLMKVNGFLGVLCPKPAVGLMDVGVMDIWTLKDYENRSWVRKTIRFLKSWFVLDGPFPLNSSIKNQYSNSLSTGVVYVSMYDVESKSIKPVKFALGYPFLSHHARFDHVRSYTESIFPLPRN